MLFDGEGGSTEESTATDSTSVFESLLSDEPEYSETSSTPPAQKTPEPAESEPDAQDADPEPAESDEDKSPEGDEPQEEGQEPSTSLDPTLKVKVKIDGKEEEVTLDELQKGYSRTADYTRKAQAVAEHRKALEAETAAARQERARMAEHFRLLEQAVDEVRPKEPDWDKLRIEHPSEFPRVWAEWQQGEKDRSELKRMREDAERKTFDDQQKVRAERVLVERDLVLEAVPEWKDPKVAKADYDAMSAFAAKHGYSADELNGIDDHRALVMLRKAMLFDQQQAKKTEALKRIEVVKTATPGVGTGQKAPVTDTTRAFQRLAKSRSQDALAGVFRTVIDD